MNLELVGKSVVVTGASQGIGKAIGEAFAREGAQVTLVARSLERLNDLAAELRMRHGANVKVHACDLTARGEALQLAERCSEVDVLVNNAGAIPAGNLWEVDEQRWRDGWDLKVMGYIDLTRAFYVGMRERGEGVILNNIGNGGENYDFDYIAGSTGNAALMAFTRALGGRSLRDGVRVLGVNPGPVGTERIQRLFKSKAAVELGDESRDEELIRKLPRGRPASVEEIADAFVFLASARSAYSSGSIFTIDGGMSSARSIS